MTLTYIVVAALAGCAIFFAQKDEKFGAALLVGVGVAALLLQVLGLTPGGVAEGNSTPQAPSSAQTSQPTSAIPSPSVSPFTGSTP